MGEMEWTFILTGVFVLVAGVGLGLLWCWLMERGEQNNENL